jgi:iron(III) transport system permease protein
VLPLVRPGAYSIAVLLFIMAVREIGPSLFLYNSSTIVMAVQVLNNWEVGNLGGAAALSLVQSLIITVVILLSRWVFKVEVGRH